MSMVQMTSEDLGRLLQAWLHKGREIERAHWEAYELHISLMCPKCRVPLFREIVAGWEVWACPFRNNHYIAETCYLNWMAHTETLQTEAITMEQLPAIPETPPLETQEEALLCPFVALPTWCKL